MDPERALDYESSDSDLEVPDQLSRPPWADYKKETQAELVGDTKVSAESTTKSDCVDKHAVALQILRGFQRQSEWKRKMEEEKAARQRQREELLAREAECQAQQRQQKMLRLKQEDSLKRAVSLLLLYNHYEDYKHNKSRGELSSFVGRSHLMSLSRYVAFTSSSALIY